MGKQVGFEDVLRYFDEDGDGKVLPSELKHGLGMMGGELPMKEAKMAIAALDSDGDGCGFITPKRLKKILKKMGESKSIDECKSMIKQFDLNRDGVLSFEEFRIMMQ
ncbi:hypothetical protein JHK82_050802 [Glycine max]|nr:hypothetical protein JHK86_050659 [Glycine max]KAG4936581.1 hypothetical protein JHK85_051500 [Glycine max]KAG5092024.1 hypothetical protein JHK82_050802 [Glycine max]KAG5095098.1 hypothetical protein JHK84_050686 [Glycine max]